MLDRGLLKATASSSMLLVFLFVSDELGKEFSMSHDLRSTIVSLNIIFQSTKSKNQKKTTKMHFAIMKTLIQNIKHTFFFIGNIVLGLGHLLGGRQVPPLDSATDKCLPQSSQPPGKARAISFET
jgi:hypothetical protein